MGGLGTWGAERTAVACITCVLARDELPVAGGCLPESINVTGKATCSPKCKVSLTREAAAVQQRRLILDSSHIGVNALICGHVRQ